MKLTKTAVEAAALPAEGKSKVLYWDSGKGAVTGFGLSVTANGVRTYVAQARVSGKNRRIAIGRHGVWTCEEAREHARGVLLDMAKGIDPQAEKRKATASVETLREVMEHYLHHHRTGHGTPLRASTQIDIRRHIEINLKALADQPIAGITRDVCLSQFNAMTKRGLTGQANQCMVTLRALCNYAREKHAAPDGLYTILAVNPVSMAFGKHKLGKMHKIKAKTERIPTDKIGAVWAMLQKRRAEPRTVDDRTGADYVSMLILTGLRAGECARLQWENVNLGEGWFRIIADDAKNHTELRLPMSQPLREMLVARKKAAEAPPHVTKRRANQGARTANPYVFASWGKKGHITEAKGTMLAVSAVAGLHLTPHSLRRTLDDVAGVCRVGDDQRRQLLNHLASDVHGQHYGNNPDPKVLADAVDRIARWVVAQAQRAQAGNVIALPARAA